MYKISITELWEIIDALRDGSAQADEIHHDLAEKLVEKYDLYDKN